MTLKNLGKEVSVPRGTVTRNPLIDGIRGLVREEGSKFRPNKGLGFYDPIHGRMSEESRRMIMPVDQEAIARLVDLLEDQDPYVRTGAARTFNLLARIEKLQFPSSFPGLVKLLADEHPCAVEYAYSALGYASYKSPHEDEIMKAIDSFIESLSPGSAEHERAVKGRKKVTDLVGELRYGVC